MVARTSHEVDIGIGELKDLNYAEQILGRYTCGAVGTFGVTSRAGCVVHRETERTFSQWGMLAGRLK